MIQWFDGILTCLLACMSVAHLTLASEAPLVQSGPDALDPPSMLRVPTVVPAGTLVFLHLWIVHQACTHTHPHLYSDFSSLILHVPAREADLTCCEAKLWVRQGQRRHCSGWMRSKRQGGGGWGGLSADKRLMRPNQGRHAWMVQWSQEPLWFREQIWSAFSSKITRQIISILFYIN